MYKEEGVILRENNSVREDVICLEGEIEGVRHMDCNPAWLRDVHRSGRGTILVLRSITGLESVARCKNEMLRRTTGRGRSMSFQSWHPVCAGLREGQGREFDATGW